MMKRDIEDLNKEKSTLQVELSTARIQMNYEKEVGMTRPEPTSEPDRTKRPKVDLEDAFTDELLEKIESLTQEKTDLFKELGELKVVHQQQIRQLETMKQEQKMKEHFEVSEDEQKMREQKLSKDKADFETKLRALSEENHSLKSKLEGEVDRFNKALESADNDKRQMQEEAGTAKQTAEAEIAQLKSEAASLKTSLADVSASRKELQDLEDMRSTQVAGLETTQRELERVQDLLKGVESARDDLGRERDRLQQSVSERDTQIEALNKEIADCKVTESELRQEMGQNSEKLLVVEDRSRGVERERDDLKRKCKEIEAKIDVLKKTEKNVEKTTGDKLSQLEKALEEALVEREEILEAAEKEIEQTKNIAIETEQKLMDDFEWKLREVEAEYRQKINDLEISIERRIKQAKDDYGRAKDEEFTKLSIGLRREMDDNLRKERTNLRKALDTANAQEREAAIDRYKLEKDRELRILQSSWDEEQNRLNRELRALQRKIDGIPDEITAATRHVRQERDQLLHEERRKAARAQERAQDEFDRMKDELNGQMMRLRAECDERVREYEQKLESAHGNRMSSMFQMKEEVETEFTERMEQLRDMYKGEIEQQMSKLESERVVAKKLEETLRKSIDEKQKEIDELNSYYTQREDEYETKVTELLTRLQDQTTQIAKLQEELDEYEWYEEEDEEGAKEPRPPSSRSNRSRPPSTRPMLHSEDNHTPFSSQQSYYSTNTAANGIVDEKAEENLIQDQLEEAHYDDVDEEDDGPDPPPRKERPEELLKRASRAQQQPEESSQPTTYANPLRFLYL